MTEQQLSQTPSMTTAENTADDSTMSSNETSNTASTGMRLLRGSLLVLFPLILGIGGLWWFSYDTPDEQAPILPTSTPVYGARLYVVEQEGSQINASLDGPIGTLESSYEMGEGTIELTESAEGWTMVVNLTFDARTLDVGSDTTNALLRRILRTDEFPTGAFVATSQDPITELSGTQTVPIAGQMEIAGTVQDYEVDASVTIGDDVLKMTAETVVDAAVIFGDFPGMSEDQGMNANLVVMASPETEDESEDSTPQPSESEQSDN